MLGLLLDEAEDLVQETLLRAWRTARHVTCARSDVRLLPQAPGEAEFKAFKLDVVRIEAGKVAEITTFDGRTVEWFGLPLVLDR